MELLGLDSMQIAVRLGLGLAIGFCIGLTGVGGGVLLLPALTLLLRMNAVMAVGTACLYSFLTKISATVYHAKLRTIDWALSLLFLAGALPAAVAVSFGVTRYGAGAEFQHGLRIFITGTVFFCVGSMVLNLIHHIRNHDRSVQGSRLSESIDKRPGLRRVLCVALGGVVGALIGATSIGGGVLIVPILMMLFGLEAHKTVGSSIFIAVILTLGTSLSYLSGEDSIHVATACVMAVGSLAGVPLGSKLSVKMPEKTLQVVVIGLIFIAAIMMLASEGGGH